MDQGDDMEKAPVRFILFVDLHLAERYLFVHFQQSGKNHAQL